MEGTQFWVLLTLGAIFIPWLLLEISHLVRRRRTAEVGQAYVPVMPALPKTGCRHSEIEPVFAWGEADPIAWICVSPECYAKLEASSAAVARWKRDQDWIDLVQDLDEFDPGGLLPKGATVAPQTSVELWEKLPGWTDNDTERARKIVESGILDEFKVKPAPHQSWQ